MINSNGNVSVLEMFPVTEVFITGKHTHIMRRKIIMPLVTSEEMLSKAQEGGYAVGAFNAENMEMVKAIIQAAE